MNPNVSRPDLNFLDELKEYGEFDINPCYNCGTCTGVCPLAKNGLGFPRRLVHLAQLGLKDKLAASKEVWTCYYCGECTKRCPRKATPGEFMDCARRYFISHWDFTGLSGRMYKSPKFLAGFMAVLAAFFTIMFMATGGRMESEHLKLFEFIDLEWLHYTGIVIMVVIQLILLINIVNMVRHLKGGLTRVPKLDFASSLKAAFYATQDTIKDLAFQKQFAECNENETEDMPWYLTRRVVHLAIMWGFLGLLGATGLDLLFKEPGTHVPLYYPMRLLGTVAGLVLVYGTSAALYLRKEQKGGPSLEQSLLSDWVLLWMLWSTALSGFVLEIAVYLPEGTILGYLIFLVHVVLAIVLLLLLPFTKFAHAIYRPVAIWIHAFWLRRQQRTSIRTLWAARAQKKGAQAS